MALVLRNVKGSRLTFTELDGNFTYLEGLDLSGVTYNIGSQLLTLTRNNGGTLTTTIPSGGAGQDIFVTGGTADVASSTLTFTNSTGGTFNVTNSAALFSDNDINVTGGTYNQYTGCVTFGTNSGTTFDICGFVTGMTDTYVTGGTLNGSYELTLGRTILGDVPAIDLSPLVTDELNDLIDANTANSSVVLANRGAGIQATAGTGVGNFVAISGALSGTTGNDNIVIGRNAATNKIGAADNIVMGLSALGSSSSSSPTKNIMIGYRTGFNLYDNTENIMIGYQAGDSTTANDYSTIVGSYAGLYQYGDHQTIIGYRAGQDDTGFAGFTSSCTLLGSHAGHNVVGTANIAIGYEAGYNGSVVTQYIGSHNILLGNGVTLNASGTTRQLVVGGLDRYLLSGDFNTTDRAKLGVNISNDIPTANLQVKGHASDTTTVLIQDGSDNTLVSVDNVGNLHVTGRTTTENFTMTTGAVNSYVLTSDAGGNASWAASSGGGGSFTGNTSGTCITDIWVSNIHSCSPLNINPGDEGSVYFGSSSGVTINVADERVGIGTAGSTNYKLWIKEATTHAQGKIESDNSYARWIIDSHDTNDSILQFNEAGTRRWQIAVDGTDDYMKFTRGDITVGGYTTALVIDTSDNVGIGTANPDEKLHVSGNTSTQIKITGGLNAGLIIDGAENSFVEFKEDASRKWIVGNHQSDDHFKWATGTTFNSDTVMELSRVGGLTVHNFQMLSGATADYVLTSDASGNGRWAAAGGGGGCTDLDCLTDCFVGDGSGIDYNILISNGATAGGVTQSGTLGATAIANIAIGADAGKVLAAGAQYNTLIGHRAGDSITTSDGNTCLGPWAGQAITTTTGFNTFLGYQCGYLATGNSNVAIGKQAGRGVLGNDNIAIGLSSMFGALNTPSENICLGQQTGYNLDGSWGNIFIGKQVGFNHTTGNANIAMGYGQYLSSSNTVNRELTIGYSAAIASEAILMRGDYSTTNQCKLIINADGPEVPTATLHVKGQGNLVGTTSLLVKNSDDDSLFTITDDGATKVLLSDFYITQVPSAATLATNADGKIVDPASDIRLKKNILNLQHLNPLEFIKALKGYEFEWRVESNMDWVPGRKHYGFLANQVKGIQVNAATNIDHQHYMEKDSNVTGGNASYTNRVGVGNNMVYETSTKFRHRDSQTVPQQVEGVNYIDMIPWLVEALKELSGNVDNIDSSVSGALEKFLQEGRYDASTEEIILTLNNNDVVRFPVSSLLDNTNNYVITGTSVNNVLTLTRHGLPDIIIPIDGLKGDKGDTGNTGATGAAGADGNDGTNGTDGVDGSPGVKGDTGNTGATGAAGADGADGAQGIQGAAGADGTDGADGSDGIQGPAGVPGNSGSNKKYAADISFVADTTKIITHSLNDKDVIVQLKDNAGNLVIPESVNNYQLNTIDITVSISGTYRVIILG
tara:strand:- start:2634 stop:6938 length:4305 start_codon:yes stop_codon:yes gene_type:complete